MDPEATPTDYKNNLKTLFATNSAKILAIIPRTFNAKDTNGNEMIIIRGNVYPIIRLHELFGVPNAHTNIEDGILIWVQSGEESICLFVDELLGEQQIVVNTHPSYLSRYDAKSYGISGCTILGDGNISLILDIGSIIDKTMEKR